MSSPLDATLAPPARTSISKRAAPEAAPRHQAPQPLCEDGEEPGRFASRLVLERARMAAAMRKWETAVVLLGRALPQDPDDAAALGLYGYCLSQLGRNLEEARVACRRAVDLESYVALHHAELGCVYRAAGLQGRARECFREALRLDPALELAREGLSSIARRTLASRLRDLLRISPR